METYRNSNDTQDNIDEIDIKKLLFIIWDGKITIAILTILFSFLTYFYSINLPNIYESRALLNTAEEMNSRSQSGSLGGLASFAGINISSGGGKASLAIKKIKTLSFYEDSILPNIYLPDLMAFKSWDPVKNSNYYDENLYNLEKNTWISMPSAQTSYSKFNSILSISESLDNNFITISVKHQSPYVAQAWAELVVDQINDYYRVIDKKEAKMSIDFLNAQMAQTSYTELKQAISQLIKQKMQKLTLIEANKFYIFSYLDPPKVMESKIEPDRMSITILGAIIGIMLGLMFVLARNFFSFKSPK
jgi:uncharacterized protein involved in exopolysaccharide biosynthesis